MKFVKCKNETEKLQAIKEYCNDKIKEYNQRIDWLKANQTSAFDYVDEIEEYRFRIAHFETILKIINADEYTSIMVV